MIDRDESAPLGPEDADDALAAEYVLRVLDRAEEAAARRREAADPDFAARVAHWRDAFAHLDDGYGSATPSPRLWSRIDRRLFAPGPQVDAAPGRGLALWRGLALAAALVAALALGLVVFRTLTPAVDEAQPLVSALSPVESDTEFLALLDPDTGTLRINRTAGDARPGRSFELWLIEGDAAPVSLGVLPDEPSARLAVAPELLDRFRTGITLAVTDEPLGGSPTGAATGPVVAAGEAQTL